jgi:glutathione synthase/RimK-type ligase-like ATP-grasp enzyme
VKTIFILTSSYDLTTDFIINKYRDLIPLFRFNLDRYEQYKVSVRNDIITISDSQNRKCYFDENTTILFRKPSLPNYELDQPVLEFCHKEIYSQLEGIIESHEGIIVDKPCKLRRANNKVLQLKLAQKVGLNVPESFITNNCSDILSNKDRLDFIIKPISIGKIVQKETSQFIQTELLDASDTLANLSYCPSYFQEYKAKDYELRITIVGDRLFPVRIDSPNNVDWRKTKKNKYSCTTIPDEITNKALMLMKELGLKFGAFDFIVNNGKYFFLEINPNGQWLWLEQKLSLNISDSLINDLLQRESCNAC